MARWRDIKNNRVEKPIEKEELDSSNSSTPISLFTRFKAFIVDSFMITMPIMYFVIYIVMGSGDNFSQNKALGWSIILGAHALVMLAFLFIKKETPGMRAYGLKLIHSNPNKNINIFQILIRYILTLPSIIALGSVPFFRKDRKMFHDLISNTYFSLNDKNLTK
jgi:uncharacterized RDD family membrane protein YckC